MAAGLDGIRLISADRPGIGQTPRAPARRVVDWAADVERLADSLGIERFAVAGWSAGGPFALACAARLTGRVTAAATLGGIAPPAAKVARLGLRTDRLLEHLARTAPALGRAALQTAARIGDQRAARETLRALPECDRRVLADLPAAQIVRPFRAALAQGAAGTMDDYRAFGSAWGFELSDVRVPVTCWHGELDTLVPRSHAEYLVDHLPNARLEQVAGAGHFMMVQHAGTILGPLRDEMPDGAG